MIFELLDLKIFWIDSNFVKFGWEMPSKIEFWYFERAANSASSGQNVNFQKLITQKPLVWFAQDKDQTSSVFMDSNIFEY